MRIVFMGTPDFAVPSLKALVEAKHQVVGVVSQPDRPKGRKRILTPPPVKELALQYGIEVIQPERIRRDQEAFDRLVAWQPDLIVTAAFGQILPKRVLEIPPLGCVNVHASLLPKYRGAAPIQKAIMAGEAETGITIMYMVEALDAGDIIAQKGLPILPEDDAGTLFLKLSELGAKLLLDTLPQLRAGRVEAIPQDEEKVSYAPILKREDEQIDWQKDAAVIVNHIRALSPMPGAFTTAFGQVCKIWRGKYVNTLFNGQPGTIQQISKEGITVVAGDGQGVQLLTLQPAGKKRMDVEDFLRGAGASWTVGQQLGGLL